MPKQAAEQIENLGVNLGRPSPASGGRFSTPDHTETSNPCIALIPNPNQSQIGASISSNLSQTQLSMWGFPPLADARVKCFGVLR
jgi:hypothetical protein